MIKIKQFPTNAFSMNSYIVSAKGECFFIDAGYSSEKEYSILENYLKENSLKPVGILLTHAHLDHIVGASYLIKKYNVECYIHKEDIQIAKLAPDHAKKWGFPFGDIPSSFKELTEGNFPLPASFDGISLSMLHLPGHSPGSLSYTFTVEGENHSFVGDVLFKGSIGRSDLPLGDYPTLMHSIIDKLLKLDPETVIYSGHGANTTLNYEALHNPFITEALNGEVKY